MSSAIAYKDVMKGLSTIKDNRLKSLKYLVNVEGNVEYLLERYKVHQSFQHVNKSSSKHRAKVSSPSTIDFSRCYSTTANNINISNQHSINSNSSNVNDEFVDDLDTIYNLLNVTQPPQELKFDKEEDTSEDLFNKSMKAKQSISILTSKSYSNKEDEKVSKILLIRSLSRCNDWQASLSLLLDYISNYNDLVQYKTNQFPNPLIIDAITSFIQESFNKHSILNSFQILDIILQPEIYNIIRIPLNIQVFKRPKNYSKHFSPCLQSLIRLLDNTFNIQHRNVDFVKYLSNDQEKLNNLLNLLNFRWKSSYDGFKLYENLIKYKIEVDHYEVIKLMNNLLTLRAINEAKLTFYSIRSHSIQSYLIGLKVFAHDGDISMVDELKNLINQSKSTSTNSIERNEIENVKQSQIIISFAQNGDVVNAMKVFEEKYNKSDIKPSQRDLYSILLSYTKRDDLNGALNWIKIDEHYKFMNKSNLYSALLSLFSKRNDLTSSIDLLERMKIDKVDITLDHFSKLLQIFAKRGDSESCENLIKDIIKLKYKPNIVIYSILMNSYTNANEWMKVIKLYKFLNKNEKQFKLNCIIANILIKAYVMLGSSFENVLQVIREMLNLKIRANEHTFALAMQSACDMGRINTAIVLFEEMEKWSNGKLIKPPNVVHYTIIIAALLRVGSLTEARDWYNRMKDNGVQPDSLTYGIIISSYVQRNNDEDIEIAKMTIKNLFGPENYKDWLQPKEINSDSKKRDRVWMEMNRSKDDSIQNVLLPLIQSYGKNFTPDLANESFDYMQTLGVKSNIKNLTILMDGYRRVDNYLVVKEIWDQIIKIFRRKTHKHKNDLCLPLSVLTDVLSNRGNMDEINECWKLVKDLGCSFDGHNWNHLAIGMNQLGEIEVAFDILERLLKVYEKKRRNFYYFNAVKEDESEGLEYFLNINDKNESHNESKTENGSEKDDNDVASPNRPSSRRSNVIGKEQDKKIESEDVTFEGKHTTTVNINSSIELLKYLQDIEVEGGNHMVWYAHNRTLMELSKTLKTLENNKLPLNSNTTLKPNDVLNNILNRCPKSIETIKQYRLQLDQQLELD